MMIRERVLKAAVMVGVVWLASALPASAQADGRFAGAVLDASGAFVPNATITVRNEKTGEERTITSSGQGLYLVTNLKPSAYTIRAKSGDFAPLEYTGLQLLAGQEFRLDLELKPAGVSESVTVQGTTSSMDLSSARIGVNVSEREVLNLPVNGRQMSQLMLQAPGSVNSGTGTWQDVRFSGRPAGDAEPRPAVRVLHAAHRNQRSAGEVQHRYRRHRAEHGQAVRDEEEQHPAARVVHLRARQDGVQERLRHVRGSRPDRRPKYSRSRAIASARR